MVFGNLCVIQSVHNQVLLVSVFYRINIQKIPKKYTKDKKNYKKIYKTYKKYKKIYKRYKKNTKKYTKDTKKLKKIYKRKKNLKKIVLFHTNSVIIINMLVVKVKYISLLESIAAWWLEI